MIDTVRIKTKVKYENLIIEKWQKRRKKETDEEYYETFIKSIRLGYYPLSESLIISGNFMRIQDNNKTLTYDDKYTNKMDLIVIFANLEEKINTYFSLTNISILKEKISRIDYCFNITTEYAERYIEFFNACYKKRKDTKFKNYINYTLDNELDEKSSFYLKTRGQYKHNLNQNFTINFYSKYDQLCKKNNVSAESLKSAKNILRLEVQVHYAKLKSICKRHSIPWKHRDLYHLFNINIARDVVCHEIERFFGSSDFYSYKEAKKIVTKETHKNQTYLSYICDVSRNYKTTASKKTIKRLNDMGIFPYMFLPKEWKIDKLENPIKLIDKKICENNSTNLFLKGGVKSC